MQSLIQPPLRSTFDHQMLVKLKLRARPKVTVTEDELMTDKRRYKPSLKLNSILSKIPG